MNQIANIPLYQIGDEYQKVLAELHDLDIDDETLADTLESLDIATDFQSKGLSVAAFFQNIDAGVEAMKAAKKRMDDRIKVAEGRSKRMKQYLLDNMLRCEITEITCPEFTIKTAKTPPSVEVDDMTRLAERFTRVTVAPDKAAIKKAIKDGEEVSGVRLVSGHRLSIK